MKLNRNSPCPCGSEKKAKHCCHRPGINRAVPKPSVRVPMKVIQRAESTEGIIRECGGCQACCSGALSINDPDLVAPKGRACEHRSESGCSIHGPSMPKTCSGFACSYLVEPGGLTEKDRPDHVGAFVRLARNLKAKPPMDRTVFLNECKTGGLFHILQNRSWGMIIRNDLLAGIPLLCTYFDDSLAQEVIHFRFVEGLLKCELTSCREDGTPILKTREPVIREPIMGALMIPQGFALDTSVLIRQLGRAQNMVLSSSTNLESTGDIHFWFTQRQARLARAVMQLIEDGVDESASVQMVSTMM